MLSEGMLMISLIYICVLNTGRLPVKYFHGSQGDLNWAELCNTSLSNTDFLASHADVLRGLSHVPAPRTSAEASG